MDFSTVLLAVVLATVALTSPFGLRFDQAGLGGAPLAVRGCQALFAVMALLFSTGFVGLAAVATGAFLGFDGLAAMIPLAWLWAPLLLVATALAARRDIGGQPR